MIVRQFLIFGKKKIDNKSNKIDKKFFKAYGKKNKIYKTNKKDIVIFKISYVKAL